MQVQEVMFGGESFWVVKFDDALEKCRIADLLKVNLQSLKAKKEREVRVSGERIGKKTGYRHQITASKICFYCGSLYGVKINKKKVWRDYCQDPECHRKYSRDRYLYRQGRFDEMQKEQLIRNLRVQGMNVSRDRKPRS